MDVIHDGIVAGNLHFNTTKGTLTNHKNVAFPVEKEALDAFWDIDKLRNPLSLFQDEVGKVRAIHTYQENHSQLQDAAFLLCKQLSAMVDPSAPVPTIKQVSSYLQRHLGDRHYRVNPDFSKITETLSSIQESKKPIVSQKRYDVRAVQSLGNRTGYTNLLGRCLFESVSFLKTIQGSDIMSLQQAAENIQAIVHGVSNHFHKRNWKWIEITTLWPQLLLAEWAKIDKSHNASLKHMAFLFQPLMELQTIWALAFTDWY